MKKYTVQFQLLESLFLVKILFLVSDEYSFFLHQASNMTQLQNFPNIEFEGNQKLQ